MEILPSELLHILIKDSFNDGNPHVRFVCKQWHMVCGSDKKNMFRISTILTSINMVNCYIWILPNLVNSICEHAAKNNRIDILQYAREKGYSWSWKICYVAALKGHLEILKWARKNGCPWNSGVCSTAAKNGNFELLMWARENGCPWDKWTCYNAAIKGRSELLKWVIEQGCPHSKQTLQLCIDQKMLGH